MNKTQAWLAIGGVVVLVVVLSATASNPAAPSTNSPTTVQNSPQTAPDANSPAIRQNSQQAQAIAPSTAPQAQAITKQSCGFKAEFDADKAWMRACYLKGLVTVACQQLYDSQGVYIPAKDSSFFGGTPTHFGESLNQYVTDKSECFCTLPTALAQQLNDSAASAEKFCDIYPNATGF